jgi:hypothetical protein
LLPLWFYKDIAIQRGAPGIRVPSILLHWPGSVADTIYSSLQALGGNASRFQQTYLFFPMGIVWKKWVSPPQFLNLLVRRTDATWEFILSAVGNQKAFKQERSIFPTLKKQNY